MTRNFSLPTFTLAKLLLTSNNLNYPRKNPIHVKHVYASLSNQIKLENPKSSLPSKRFIILLSTTLHIKKLIIRFKHISRILPILISTTANLHMIEHHILQNLRKNKNIVITKSDKGNAVVIFCSCSYLWYS